MLIGGGPDEPRLKAKVERLGLADRVDFLGIAPLSRRAPLLPRRRRLLVPFQRAERSVRPRAGRGDGVRLPGVEYRDSAQRRPVGESPRGNRLDRSHQRSRRAGRRGTRLLDEPELRTRLANAAQEHAAEELDHRVMAERSLDIYRQVLADPGLTGPAGRPVMVPSLP